MLDIMYEVFQPLLEWREDSKHTLSTRNEQFFFNSQIARENSFNSISSLDLQKIDRLKILRFGANWSSISLEDKKDGIVIFDRGKAVATLLEVKTSNLSDENFIFFDESEMSNQNNDERQTIVISTPSANDRYYSDVCRRHKRMFVLWEAALDVWVGKLQVNQHRE